MFLPVPGSRPGGAPFHFINYQITYSILSAVIGHMDPYGIVWHLNLGHFPACACLCASFIAFIT